MLTKELKDLTLNNHLKVTTDTRKLKKGDYYIPVVGEKYDGHTYVSKALELGAAGILEEQDLYELVKIKLDYIKPKIVGITGSSGKTTVTRFLHQLLSTTHKTCLGSLNTKLGLSMNVINDMNLDCEIFIAEMGMDREHELFETTELFNTDVAVITTINEAHLSKLKTLDNIVKAKFEISSHMKPNSALVLNADNVLTTSYSNPYIVTNLIWFGIETSLASVTPRLFDVKVLRVPGKHNLYNVLAALSAIYGLGFGLDTYVTKLGELNLPKGRLNLLQGINGSKILDDTYNANPESTCAALDVLYETTATRKIVILGDMRELGDFELPGHIKVAEYLSTNAISLLITVGELGKMVYDNAKITNKFHIKSSEDFGNLIAQNEILIQEGDLILIKGSQGVRMEKITKLLLKFPETAGEVLVRQDASWD